MNCDIIIFGGGPGGYTAALTLARAGKSVCLFEAKRLGGTCLNVGCIPTKYLLDRAAALEKIRLMTADGILRGGGEFSFAAIQRGKDAAINRLCSGLSGLVRSSGIVVVNGEAELLSDRTVLCDGKRYNAENLIIASGSVPSVPKFPGAELCLDSTAMLSLKRVPRRLCVIGGGVIGLELGSAFLSYGSEVEVVEMLPSILGNELPEAAGLLTRRLCDRKMKFRCDTKVTAVEKTADGFTVHSSTGDISADSVLLAAGRKPNTERLDLAGLKIATERGAIKVDAHMRTSCDGIFAIGDVIGGYMLAHAAEAEAEVAAGNILGKNTTVDYRIMPRCVYTFPSFAAVGLTVSQAGSQGIDAYVGRGDYTANGMAVAEGEGGCAFAVIDKKSETVLGFAVVGASAPELIAAASVAVERRYTVSDWQKLTVAHPTLSETLKSAVCNK